jgi:hypothetical protein
VGPAPERGATLRRLRRPRRVSLRRGVTLRPDRKCYLRGLLETGAGGGIRKPTRDEPKHIELAAFSLATSSLVRVSPPVETPCRVGLRASPSRFQADRPLHARQVLPADRGRRAYSAGLAGEASSDLRKSDAHVESPVGSVVADRAATEETVARRRLTERQPPLAGRALAGRLELRTAEVPCGDAGIDRPRV